jgi:hypothetical protein
MNNSQTSRININLFRVGLCAVAALFCSCAATSVKKTWKAPDAPAGPMTSVAVITVEQRGLLREGFENRLVGQLRKRGVKAITTFDLLSLTEIKQDKQAAAERLRSAGAQAVVVLRLVDVTSFYRETRPGPQRYAEVVTGMQPGTWYGYYDVAFMDMSPTYGNLKQKVYLETAIFDLTSAKRLWSGITETVVKENMDRIAEMDPLVAKIVDAMHQDGMVP